MQQLGGLCLGGVLSDGEDCGLEGEGFESQGLLVALLLETEVQIVAVH